VVDRAMLVHIPHHRLRIAAADQFEPPVVAVTDKRVEIAVDPAVRALSTDEQ
jgi:hypothetical protein